MSTPSPLGSRTHSIWLSQLLLAIVVVVIVLLVQTLSPETLNLWTFTVGVSLVVVVTAVALAVPWHLLPPWAVLVVPLLDIIAVGIMTRDTSIDFAFLWVFPITWIASHFPLWATGTALGTIVATVLAQEVQRSESANGTLRVVVFTLSLTFIAISTHSASRQTRAFKRLLRREATKLNETLSRAKRQEREMSRVLGSIDVGVVRLSADGSILEANRTYEMLYDVTAGDSTYSPRSVEYDGFQGSPLSNRERPITRARSGEQFEDVRTWLFTSDGSWRAMSLSALLLPEDRGLPTGESLLLAHDITAMTSAQRARDILATSVSHELRNPLTTVIGYSDLVLENADISDRVREQVEAINAAAERMMKLAGQILHAGRQATMEQTPMTATDLVKVVSDSVESFAPAAEAGGVAVHFAASDVVIVHGDGFRLRQVSDNLLSNAIKYTPKGGRVTVEVYTDEAPAADAPPVAVLRITDSGMGMEQHEVDRIFEPYFRSAAATASTIMGTGLGMGIVQSLVTQHEGTLDVQSAPGRGTTVSVTLPTDESLEDLPWADALDGSAAAGRATTDA